MRTELVVSALGFLLLARIGVRREPVKIRVAKGNKPARELADHSHYSRTGQDANRTADLVSFVYFTDFAAFVKF